MENVNLWAVLAATAGQFVVGMFWYTTVFGKLWGKMHGFDSISKAKQKELMSKMGPIYAVQLLVTILVSFALAKLMVLLPDYSVYTLAFLLWVGFVVPTHYSNVAFGGTESKWFVKKLAVLSFGSLAALLVAAFILQLF